MAAGCPYALCIFDLDGTLVDSLRDIGEAVNDCLDRLGLPTREIAEYRYLVGEGVPMLARRAIGETHPHLVDRLADLTRALYRVRPLDHTRPYSGVQRLVRAVGAAGAKLAVLSNKPHELSVRVVRAFWPEDAFAIVQGYVREEHRKPDPFHVRDICARLGVATGNTCLIGDTPTDVETARRAGTDCLAVTWGFRTREDLQAAGAERIVDSPREAAGALGVAW